MVAAAGTAGFASGKETGPSQEVHVTYTGTVICRGLQGQGAGIVRLCVPLEASLVR